jgi:prophage protein DUF1660
MRVGALLCPLIGHKWQTVASDTAIEPVLECSRCSRRTLVPNATGFGVRTEVKAGYTRSWVKK